MRLSLASLCVVLATGCFPGTPDPASVLDGPIDGLTPSELAAHTRGDTQFARSFTFSEGLGPTFVASSCEACHPGDGRAHPELALVRFGRYLASSFDPMVEAGGPQLQSRAAPGAQAEQVPPDATGVTTLIAPPVGGLGLIEAVDDATILSLEDPNDLDGDGISGRAQRVSDTAALSDLMARDVARPVGAGGTSPYVGRFGRKASAVTLLHQALTAYVQDMGVTTPFKGVALLAGSEVLDAGFEIDVPAIADVGIYLRTLKAPPRRDENDPRVQDGQGLFDAIGCSGCHTATLTTGASSIAALRYVTFAPYSDLLLHDMGPELDDGYTEGVATTAEWRTTPLWGLGLAARSQGGEGYYLHDGRAHSFAECIAYHGGEGAASRAAFEALADHDKAALLAFLESL